MTMIHRWRRIVSRSQASFRDQDAGCFMPAHWGVLVLLALLLLPVQIVRADGAAAFSARDGNPPKTTPNEALGEVHYQQNLGKTVPGDVAFVDEQTQRLTLNQIADDSDKPVVLVLGYYSCKMLCSRVLSDLAESVDRVPYTLGRDYEIVFISINPRETPDLARQKKKQIIGPDPHDGWNLLTSDKQAIQKIANAVGFGYAYESETDQYAHPAGAVILTPKLTIARYLLGMRFPARDMKFAMIEASNGNVGSAVDKVLLRCYAYNPATGQYGFAITTALNIAAGSTVLGLTTMIGLLSYKHRRQKLTEPAEAPGASQSENNETRASQPGKGVGR